MKFVNKVKFILPMLLVAQTASAAVLPKREPKDILLVATSLGAEVNRKLDLKITVEDCTCAIHKAVNSDFLRLAKMAPEARQGLYNNLLNLTEAEREAAIIGFVTLLMLEQKDTNGVSIKGAVDAAKHFADMPNSPAYFKNFVNLVEGLGADKYTDKKGKQRNMDAGYVLSKLTAAKNSLPKKIINHLEDVEKAYNFVDDNEKMRAINALLRNNKNYK